MWLLFIAVHELLIVVASLVVEHGFYSTDSVVAVHGLSYSKACGIFPDRTATQDLPGQNLCPCIDR